MFYTAIKLQKIQEKENLKTYKQFLDYMYNKKARNDPKKQNKKKMNLQKTGWSIVGALIGFFLMSC